MPLDPVQSRTLPQESPLARREADPNVFERAAHAVDAALAPIDHFKDELTGGIARVALEAEERKEGTVVGAVMQFLHGAASAGWAMVDGTYQMVRHPIRTVEGLWTLASHVPLSPTWIYRMAKEGPKEAFASDRQFWGAVATGVIAPYREDWQAGRYFAVAGRAAVDIGTLLITANQVRKTYKAWKGRRAAGAAVDDAARTAKAGADDGLKAAALEGEPRVSGQVVPEGKVVVGKPASGDARAMLERAKAHFEGNRTKARKAVVESFKKERAKALSEAADSPWLSRDRAEYRRMRQVGYKRLSTDAALQKRYKLVTRSVDRRMDQEIEQLIGVAPEGIPKRPNRAAFKLQKLRGELHEDLRLGDLDDLTRGRINLPSYKPKQIKDMVKALREHYGDDNMIIHDYLDAKPFYKGRIHVKVRDGSGMWYELQVGSRQLTTFYDTFFDLNGRAISIHDAIYKGIMMLDDDAVKLLGKGDLEFGTYRLGRVMNQYVDDLNDVLAIARKGKPYDFASHTAKLRKAIADLVGELPSEKLPIGLQA